jgi:hypothetical protein
MIASCVYYVQIMPCEWVQVEGVIIKQAKSNRSQDFSDMSFISSDVQMFQ